MFEGKYSKLLTGLLIAGIVIILGVIIFIAFTIIKNGNINSDAEDAVEQFQGQVNAITNETTEGNVIANEVNPIIGIENSIADNNSSSSNTPMYKGFPMVGTIEIPSINLQYPILQEASKGAIEVAVAIYDGPGLNEIGNTTIVGHNYRNGTFFSNNKKIVNGDKIYITDTAGRKVTYIVYNTYTTSPEDSSYLDRDTDGKREISLNTCTDDSQSRLIVLAREQ